MTKIITSTMADVVCLEVEPKFFPIVSNPSTLLAYEFAEDLFGSRYSRVLIFRLESIWVMEERDYQDETQCFYFAHVFPKPVQFVDHNSRLHVDSSGKPTIFSLDPQFTQYAWLEGQLELPPGCLPKNVCTQLNKDLALAASWLDY